MEPNVVGKPDEPSQANNNFQPVAVAQPNGFNPAQETFVNKPSFSPNFGSIRQAFSNITDSDFNGTHYLLMYALSLGLITSILSGLASLLEICFNYVGGADTSGGAYFSGYTTKLLAWLVINLLVATPIYIYLFFRLRKTQPETLPLFSRRVRGFLFGCFMTILGLVTVTSLANVIYSVAVQFLPDDGSSTKAAWWAGLGQALIMTILLAATFWYQLKSFRSKKEN